MSGARVPEPRVDEAGVWLLAADDGAVDVLVDGRRVWSFNPRRDAESDVGSGLVRVPWPEQLRRFLHGDGQLSVREHVSGRTLFDGWVRFGDSGAPLRIEDAAGHPLAVTKTGAVGRSFAERDPAITTALVGAARDAIARIREEAGLPAFLAFGGLLGAVRDGRLIGHDADLDIAYLAPAPFPVDAARSSFRLERLFRRAGWTTLRSSAADFKVQAPGLEGSWRWIDVFGAFHADGTLYVMPNVAVAAERVALLPLGDIELEGVPLPAPVDPAALLAATYGAGWNVPDPSFKFPPRKSVTRRLYNWMRGPLARRKHWFAFYGTTAADAVPSAPSSFAEWFASREPPGSRVVDLGCGTGRDSLWLCEQGYDVRGVDYALAAVERVRAEARSRRLPAQFHTVNLSDTRHVLVLGGLLSHERAPVHLYARFLLTAVTDFGRDRLWLLARTALRRGGRLYLEFRAPDPDGAAPAYAFGEHPRTLLSARQVTGEISAAGGRIEHREEGKGLAPLGDEDPYVCRLVASWPRVSTAEHREGTSRAPASAGRTPTEPGR